MKQAVPFNAPPFLGREIDYMREAAIRGKISGDGAFTERCHRWMKKTFKSAGAFLTTSCTHALEMAAILCGIEPGDEVIMPSFTFVSTATAFALRGAKIVFVDIRPDTMCLDEDMAEAAVTPKTRAIVPVCYAGSPCDMTRINSFARDRGIWVVEDAAQAFLTRDLRGWAETGVAGGYCGASGDFGCFSFHESKNISCGEGGALLIRDAKLVRRAEIIREKGTNRSGFFRGEVDKYTWTDIGSSYLPSDLSAAYLFAQIERAEQIIADRMKSWNFYFDALQPLEDEGFIELPHGTRMAGHNAHIFHIKVAGAGADAEERDGVIAELKADGVDATFHYVPLHSSPAGAKYGEFRGEDVYTTRESDRLIRLPLYYGLTREDAERVVGGLFAAAARRRPALIAAASA